MSGYTELKNYLGKHENRNTKELNDFIGKYVKEWRGFSVQSTPWCAAIWNAAERAAGLAGNGKLNARAALTYGTCVYDRNKKLGSWKDGARGDVVIFERGGSSWQGHIAYIDGIEQDKQFNILIRTLGGNQSDSVSIGWYPLARVLGIRRSR